MSDVNGDQQANVDRADEDGEMIDHGVDEIDPEETTVLSDDVMTDNVGDVSVEINVEQLIADIEKEEDPEVARKKEVRRRLEEMAEEKSFEDTYAIDVGKE